MIFTLLFLCCLLFLPLCAERFQLRPDAGTILSNLPAEPQVPPKQTQMRIDVCYLMSCVASFPFFPIQLLALNDQRVDLSLQGFDFPGQLSGILDMVLPNKLKLPLVAVQLRDLLPHRKWD